MIVRISGQGQFEIPDDCATRLNELDNEAVAAVDAGDEGKFAELWNRMLELVTSEGRELDDEELIGSDVILPPRDSTFAEAKAEFSGDGLIPD